MEYIDQQMRELNEQFTAFLHTKGIKAKFKLAFNNMSESAKAQHAADVAAFEAAKAKAAEDNAEFAAFLHTKGIKAKYKLVIENIKQGAKTAPADTAAHIAKVQAQTRAAVARASALGKPEAAVTEVSAATLQEQFNAFLKEKGLDGKYTVSVTEE